MGGSEYNPDTSPQSTSSLAKRKRSRAGCYTCRRRKKACDSARPVCGSCTRLGIPCVFPKLYRNAKGELVPSPQPNGRTKKLRTYKTQGDSQVAPMPYWFSETLAKSEDSHSPETVVGHIASGGISGATASSNPWDATPTGGSSTAPPAHPSTWQSHPSAGSTTYGLEEVDGDVEGEDLSDTALDQFLASLGDTTEGGTGWVWPLFTDSALELQLGPSNVDPAGTSTSSAGSTGGHPDNNNSSNHQNTASNHHGSSHHGPAGSTNSNLFMSNKMVTAAAVLEHLPALYDYWVNSFAHVLSVLGPGHNPQVNGMLPVVQRSPLVMCALIAWAATHRANIGHPYEEVARLATDTTELQIDQFDIEREFTPDEREEYMWTLLILGGLEIVRGDVSGWVKRLPTTRRLLCKAVENVDFKTSLTWQSLAYNCAYHDVCAQLTTTASPDFPMELYLDILHDGQLEIDSYMGATRRLFAFLCEIAVLAGQVYETMSQPYSEARERAMALHIAKSDEILSRLRSCDVPPSLFAFPLPIGTDRSLLVIAFQTFQIASELYLRQAVLRTGSADIINRQLAARILKYMRLMLGTPNESQMMFPLFLAGVCTQHEAGRTEIMSIFTKFSQRVQVRNVFTVVNLLLEVWKRDPDGDKYVDWRKLAEESNVAVSFA